MFVHSQRRRQAFQIGVALLLVIGAGLSISCRREPAKELHAAAVPVRPLAHSTRDATVEFPESFPLQVAVYWTNHNENVLAMTHSLGAMGVPFFVTRNLDQALRHRLVVLYPETDGRTFPESEINQLRTHVENGGSIFAVNVVAGSAKTLFGFDTVSPSRRRYRVNFASGGDAILRYLNRPEELEVPLGSPQAGDIFWTNGYVAGEHATVLGRFEDGSVALLSSHLGKGQTYLAGVSYNDVVLRNQVDRDFQAERHYVNTFEPGADVWMLLLRAWYESSAGAVRLDTMPAGNSSVLLLSHDVDWENSFDPALDFAQLEKKYGASSTFFIQTKYVSDANSKAFFFGKDLEDLLRLRAYGSSIGSHSIIHSRGFNKFELGSGTETFPTYQPRGTGFESSSSATVFGEVRVSKELLDGNLPGQSTVFFRAGHLRVPPSLPEALERCGYEFDSSFTADDVLTNFPYRLPLDLGFDEESGLYEFPVTFEDEAATSLAQRINQTLDVIRANAENGAMNVLLIHSNERGSKLAAEEELLRRLPSNVATEDMLSFARFWRARDRLQWTATVSGAEVVLTVRSAEDVRGITLDFNRQIDHVDNAAALLPDLHRIVLPELSANEQVVIHVHYVE